MNSNEYECLKHIKRKKSVSRQDLFKFLSKKAIEPNQFIRNIQSQKLIESEYVNNKDILYYKITQTGLSALEEYKKSTISIRQVRISNFISLGALLLSLFSFLFSINACQKTQRIEAVIHTLDSSLHYSHSN